MHKETCWKHTLGRGKNIFMFILIQLIGLILVFSVKKYNLLIFILAFTLLLVHIYFLIFMIIDIRYLVISAIKRSTSKGKGKIVYIVQDKLYSYIEIEVNEGGNTRIIRTSNYPNNKLVKELKKDEKHYLGQNLHFHYSVNNEIAYPDYIEIRN